MWLSEKLTSLLDLNVEETRRLREELAAVRAERDALRHTSDIAQNNFEWARNRLNSLELEKAALLAKAFKVHIPVPELVRKEQVATAGAMLQDLFAGPPLSAYDEVDEIA
jgi:predicted nuclease with TOPRIM domain